MADRPIEELLLELIPDGSARPWQPGDEAALVAAWADAEIAAWNPVPPEPSLETAARWIAGASRQTTEANAVDIVDVDASGDIRGEVGMQLDRTRRIGEVGFWVGADHRRSGVARRLLELSTLVAPHVGVDRLFAVTSVENAAANQLLDSAGWSEVATRDPAVSRAWMIAVCADTAT